MKQLLKKTMFAIFLVGMSFIAYASADTSVSEEVSEPSPELSTLLNLPSLAAEQAEWAFSGTVNNESGEHFHYFFQIIKKDHSYQGVAALIDAQKKSVLLYEEGKSPIDQGELTKKQAGSLFLRFNSVTNAWVFGVSHKGAAKANKEIASKPTSTAASRKNGFNFKIDMLEDDSRPAQKKERLREGILSLINQTGRLNGHFVVDGSNEEEFVTAQKTWFSQVWVSKPQSAAHEMTAILCEFSNGEALYAMTLPEPDALTASIAGRRDAQGMPLPISQFITAKANKAGLWNIYGSATKKPLSFVNLLSDRNEKSHLVLGFTTGLPGFCTVNKNAIEVKQG